MNFVIDGTKWDFFRAKDDCTVALLSLSWLTFSWLLMLYFVWVKEKSYLCTDKMVASEDQIVSIIKERIMIQISGWHWQKMKIIPASACIEPSMFGHCSWSDRKYPSCNQTKLHETAIGITTCILYWKERKQNDQPDQLYIDILAVHRLFVYFCSWLKCSFFCCFAFTIYWQSVNYQIL